MVLHEGQNETFLNESNLGAGPTPLADGDVSAAVVTLTRRCLMEGCSPLHPSLRH